MSTTSLPGYGTGASSLVNGATPMYSAEPASYEERIAIAGALSPRPAGKFVKPSKSGNVSLQLDEQDKDAALPLYGTASLVKGEVHLVKPEVVTNVEVKVEGKLRLKEVAEGGHTSAKLCLDSQQLWFKSDGGGQCPTTLPFSLTLPTHFEYEGKTYPLPPTYDVKLSGLPGFTATIDYSISVLVDKPHVVPSLVPLVKSHIFGSTNHSNVAVSTSFVYHPRSRPSKALPAPMTVTQNGFSDSPGWRSFHSTIESKSPNLHDIEVTLFIPASRVLCMTQPIPFHVKLRSTAVSLASFLPYGPSTSTTSTKRMTKCHLVRQTTVDVRNAEVLGTKTNIWRVDTVGTGAFKMAGDGPNWIAYSGEIAIDENVEVGGFSAAGLTVVDCVILSCTPPEPQKAPFSELRLVVPIRLTTDPYTADGTGIGAQYPNTNGNPTNGHHNLDDLDDDLDDKNGIPPEEFYRAL
ncbi:hypothetical protein PLEOSDRAFT_1113446 [Pleurotus ostreatus PC15]|uniref:Arrestin-like N-terminal domain-containing protein n=1 Tax=Pleurotus ostreatus (strain PC15) TaxID=1137138 RepID=A0A067NP90_PLEO1|nr:hypothetical protein PLEOSDRAFT_1113446 [Pleurotus ostreatus PC15]